MSKIKTQAKPDELDAEEKTVNPDAVMEEDGVADVAEEEEAFGDDELDPFNDKYEE